MAPDHATLCSVPWAASKSKGRIGQVLCQCKDQETGNPIKWCPRSITQRLTDQLASEFGLQLMSAFEHEYILLHKGTLSPVTDGADVYSTLLLSEFEDYFTLLDDNFKQAEIDIETIMSEYQRGQFEIATRPKMGLTGFDIPFMLKECTKELSQKHDFIATFMARPFVLTEGACSCGTHFNMSLWDKEGVNVFADESEPNGMSSRIRH